MWPTILIAIYCLLVALASLAGGILPSKMRLSHTGMQVIMSFVGGLVLGVGLLHLLPHSFAETGSLDQSVWAALAGLLTMFFLIRIFHVHQHGPVEQAETCGHSLCDTSVDHEEHRHHDYPTDGDRCVAHQHRYSWLGLGAGLTLHTLIDGMALAASVSAEAHDEATGLSLLGVGTFLAVVLHKPLDAMSITTVMAAGGWSVRTRNLVNLGFALMCAIGAAGFYLGIQQFAEAQQAILGWALGFAAGVFLCISLGDILPEVQFHAHDKAKLSAALVLGIALAYAIGFVEPAHQHGQPTAEPHEHEQHAEHEH
ncbi:MAG: ZIP family metal transporter [Planctomycetes bacterium]|nr:ZIP family metal transporter [Planctomycetota bacterium]MBL7043543.1 ZIP family metal transporter [Pirellulaceae bacterium]